MKPSEAYIPVSGRKPNEVDRLLQLISEIQENCYHDFRLVKKPKLQESKVKGVFIGINERRDPHWPEMMLLRCLNCSKEKQEPVTEMCPRCLGMMTDTLGLRRREEYFGEPYFHYAAKLRRCIDCDLTLVLDVWGG